MVRDLVLLFNSRLSLFPGKLKSKWTSPYLITQLFPHGVVKLENKEGVRFKVNGFVIELENKEGVLFKVNRLRIKIYLGLAETANEVIEIYHLDEV